MTLYMSDSTLFADEWLTDSEPQGLVFGLILINSVNLFLLCLILLYAFSWAFHRGDGFRRGCHDIGPLYVAGLVLYTFHVIFIIVFLSLWGESYLDSWSVHLLPSGLRSISMLLFIISFGGIYLRLPDSNPELAPRWLLYGFFPFFFLTIVRTIMHLARIANPRDDEAEILEIIYAVWFLLAVTPCCLACSQVVIRRCSESVNTGTLTVWVLLTCLFILSYSVTYVVFTSYYVVGRRRTHSSTALGLSAVRMLVPTLAFGSMLNVKHHRAIEGSLNVADSSRGPTRVSEFILNIFKRRARTPIPADEELPVYVEPPSYSEPSSYPKPPSYAEVA